MDMQTTEDAMIQNLKDAGCDTETITAFLQDLRTDQIDRGLNRLSRHRQQLLHHLHEDQKQIDCLDYLIYILEKQAGTIRQTL